MEKQSPPGRNPLSNRKEEIKMRNIAPIAQLVEQLALNETVAGSNPARRTYKTDT